MLIESAPDFCKTVSVRMDDELYYALLAISQTKRVNKSVIMRNYLVDGVLKERKSPSYNFTPSNASAAL
jgi:hypothetical protein